ncbi:MAG: ATP-binding protein [Polyangia bacterium]
MTAKDVTTNAPREGRRSAPRVGLGGQSLRYEDLFRFMAENVKDYAVFAINLAGQIASWNPGAEQVFEYSESEILGQPASVLYAPQEDPTHRLDLELGAAAAVGCTEEERWHQRKDGSRFWGTGIIAPLRDQAGQLHGFVKVCRDKTDWKTGEIHTRELLVLEQKARKHAEEEAARTLLLLAREQEARRQAERTSRLKDEFLATVSHELRTPLNAILGWTEILSGAPAEPSAVAHALEVVRRNAQAQKQLIEDLLDVSRIISGKLRLEPRPLAVMPVARAALDGIRPAADAKGITLVQSLEPVAAWVDGDTDRLQQIFLNLLSNAVKFTPRGGRVEVALRRGASCVEFVVSDTGRGIGPEFMPSLFEPFRQADASSSRAHTGLGLGLAIARHLVELHHGTLRAESGGEGQGATFTVTLPVVPPSAEHEEQDPEEELGGSDEPDEELPMLDGLRLLVVDNEQDTAEFLARMLRQRGALVELAGSAHEALAVLQRERFDVLLSDIGMPHEDGYTLIRKLRALPPERGGRTPAIALTAYAREQDRVRALRAGFQNHVAKPIRSSLLFVVVADVAGRLNAHRAD